MGWACSGPAMAVREFFWLFQSRFIIRPFRVDVAIDGPRLSFSLSRKKIKQERIQEKEKTSTEEDENKETKRKEKSKKSMTQCVCLSIEETSDQPIDEV